MISSDSDSDIPKQEKNRLRTYRAIALPASILLVISLLSNQTPAAHAQGGNAYDLIAAVNQLRSANGLPPYEINSALMAAAQSHSEYQASISTVTHSGQGGTRPRDRAAAYGYGGGATFYISENIAGGTNLTVQGAVQMWQGDSLHLDTMLGANYRDVGAGVATSGGRTYYTLDVAYVAGDAGGNSGGTGSSSTTPQTATTFFPVVVSTARPDGSIIHVVQPGQTLWSIAAAYDISLEEILSLNALTSGAVIFPGDKLLIKPAELSPTPTETTWTKMTGTPLSTIQQSPQITQSPLPALKITQNTPLAESAISPERQPVNFSQPFFFVIVGMLLGGTSLLLLGYFLKRKT